MDLKDIKTLRQVSEESGIEIRTLQQRLGLPNFGLIEGVDFKRLGKRQSTILTPAGVKKILKEAHMGDIWYSEDSSRKDLTIQELKWFYAAAGNVLNYMCMHIRNFRNMPEYRVATNSSMAHQGEKLKDYITSLTYKWLFPRINEDTKNIELFKTSMLNVIEYGSFTLDVTFYTKNLAEIYLLNSMGSKFSINENIIDDDKEEI